MNNSTNQRYNGRISSITKKCLNDKIPTIKSIIGLLSSSDIIPVVINKINSQDTAKKYAHLKKIRYNDQTKEYECFIKTILNQDINLSKNEICASFDLDKNWFKNFVIKEVPLYAPLSHNQYNEAKTIWPVIFKQSHKIEEIANGKNISESEVQLYLKRMKFLKSNYDNFCAFYMPLADFPIINVIEADDHVFKHPAMKAIDEISMKNATSDYIDSNSLYVTKQYLCTGMDVFISHEPCAMCAMALLHCRIEKLFFLYENQYDKAFSDQHILLHCNEKLNHRFSVYKIEIE